MPGIISLVNQIHTDVKAKLISAGYPYLNDNDGYAFIGRQHVNESAAPNRIVYVPTGSKFGGKEVYNKSNVVGYPSTEIENQIAQRSIATDEQIYEIYCWGQAIPANPYNDFEITQGLYQQVIMSIHLLAAGTYTLLSGKYIDQMPNATQFNKAGHEYVLIVSFKTPILDHTLDYSPSDISPNITNSINVDGDLTLGCTIS